MSIKDIAGNENAKQVMLSIINSNKIGAAYIFVGEENVGKNFAALQFAKALNCLAPQDDGDCCDECENCKAIDKVIGQLNEFSMQKNAHPDILYINTDKAKFSIDLVREGLKAINSLKVIYLKKKIVVIQDAERLTKEASNSILKELEEPNPAVVIILICNNPEAMLPTILSRCYTISIKRVSNSIIKEKLKILKPYWDEKMISEAVIYSEGKIGLAFNYEKIRENSAEVFEIFKILALKENNIEEIFKKIEELDTKFKKERENEEKNKTAGTARNFLIEMLKILAYIYKDLLVSIIGASDNFEKKYLISIEKLKNKYEPGKIISIINLIKQAQIDLELNANVNLLLNSLFFNIRKVGIDK